MKKKLFRLVLLAGVLGLTSWMVDITPAYAFGSCENINGGPCSPEGKTQRCIWNPDDGGQGLCVCFDGLWSC